MAHYAHVIDNKVVNVIKINNNDTTTIEELKKNTEGDWIQTSYNTRGNVHFDPETLLPDGEEALRYNYAGIGFFYDYEADAFYTPSPFASWVLDKTTHTWVAPIPKPINTSSIWDESTLSWLIFPQPYPSWILIDNAWIPPVPIPAPTGWLWDEESQTWFKLNPLVPDPVLPEPEPEPIIFKNFLPQKGIEWDSENNVVYYNPWKEGN
jgi:hypothetical protein